MQILGDDVMRGGYREQDGARALGLDPEGNGAQRSIATLFWQMNEAACFSRSQAVLGNAPLLRRCSIPICSGGGVALPPELAVAFLFRGEVRARFGSKTHEHESGMTP